MHCHWEVPVRKSHEISENHNMVWNLIVHLKNSFLPSGLSVTSFRHFRRVIRSLQVIKMYFDRYFDLLEVYGPRFNICSLSLILWGFFSKFCFKIEFFLTGKMETYFQGFLWFPVWLGTLGLASGLYSGCTPGIRYPPPPPVTSFQIPAPINIRPTQFEL